MARLFPLPTGGAPVAHFSRLPQQCHPAVFFVAEGGFATGSPPSLTTIAGKLDPGHLAALQTSWPALIDATARPDDWELAPAKKPVV